MGKKETIWRTLCLPNEGTNGRIVELEIEKGDDVDIEIHIDDLKVYIKEHPLESLAISLGTGSSVTMAIGGFRLREGRRKARNRLIYALMDALMRRRKIERERERESHPQLNPDPIKH